MTRCRRAVGPALVCAASIGLGLVMPAARAAPLPDNARGFGQLGSCLASADRLEALYVIDMSGSNASTDPGGVRFQALESSVVLLGDLAAGSAGRLRVDAAVAAYGDGYLPPDRVAGWRRIGAGGGPAAGRQLRAAAQHTWRDASRGGGQHTNFQAALAGARSSLLARGSERGTCRAVFWFTDGLLDLGERAATDAAGRAMCAPGGVLDRLRADDVTVVALALANPATRRQIASAGAGRRGELQAMAVGAAPGRTCGTSPIPESSRAGAYLAATDATELRALFDGAIAQGRGGTAQPVPATRPVRLTVDPGVRAFQLDLTATGPPAAVALRAPDGSQWTVPATGRPTPIGPAVATVRRFGDFVTVAVRMPGSGVAGTWTADPGVDLRSATAYLFSGLRLRFDPPALLAGTSGRLTGTAVDDRGAPADLSVYGAATLSAAQVGDRPAAGRVTDPPAGRFEVGVDPAGLQTSLALHTALRLVTASGTALALVSDSHVFGVALPASFPTVRPAAVLDLGPVDGVRKVTGRLTLVGSGDGPTRACLGRPTEVQVPERAGGTAPAYALRCYSLAAHQQVDVPVAVTPRASAEGRASAVLPLTLTGAAAARVPPPTAQRRLDVVWTMRRPVHQGTRAALVLLVTVLAVLLPLLVLWLVSRVLARFDGGDLRRAVVAVRLDAAGPRRAEHPALLGADDFGVDFLPGQVRSLPVEGTGCRLVASAPVNPLNGPRFLVCAEPGRRVVSGVIPRLAPDGRSAPATPGLGAYWFVSLSDADLRAGGDAAPAVLAVFLREYGTDVIDSIAREIVHGPDWTSLLVGLREAAGPGPAPGPDPPPGLPPGPPAAVRDHPYAHKAVPPQSSPRHDDATYPDPFA